MSALHTANPACVPDRETPVVGIDFGTTNSSVAVADRSGAVRLAQFATAGGTTASSRSLLYLQRQSAAPRKPVHVWSGPEAIEQYLHADPFDEEVQGRLIQSLKSYLAARSFTGTEIFGRHYRLEDLLAKMLLDLRLRASEALGFPVTRAVAGRPVWFVSADAEADNRFAEERLHAAFLQAGWTDIRFALEPVAAAYSYAQTFADARRTATGELVLVGDFGGGTTDFSLLRMGTAGKPHTMLGSTGVGLAGDAFDARIVRYAVSPALGSESVQRAEPGSPSKLIPALPAWIYTSLERWHTLSFLQTRQTTELLRTAALRAAEPERIRALHTLVRHDLGYRLHRAVQQVKVALSSRKEAEFLFEDEGLHLRARVTRAEFEAWIAPELQQMRDALERLLQQTGQAASAVGHVFLTGGSSLVPAVQRVFTERFVDAHVEHGEAFTSVAHGLARMAVEA